MEKKNFLWLIAFALLMPLFTLTACSDDDDDDNNDSNGDKTEQTTNDDTKVLSKKVTKIVATTDDGEEEETFYFDEDGKITSYKEVEYYNGGTDTDIYTFLYSKDQIVETHSNSTWADDIYYLENGRVVEQRDDDEDTKYTYSSDGYLASWTYGDNSNSYELIGQAKFTVTDGNYTKYERNYKNYKGEDTSREVSETISYNKKPNNLNVDLANVLTDIYWPFTEYFGKRSKNLPISSNKKSKYTDLYSYKGETIEETYTNVEVKNFEYIYDGDYPVKVVEEWTETSDEGKSYSGTCTYEIFYE